MDGNLGIELALLVSCKDGRAIKSSGWALVKKVKSTFLAPGKLSLSLSSSSSSLSFFLPKRSRKSDFLILANASLSLCSFSSALFTLAPFMRANSSRSTCSFCSQVSSAKSTSLLRSYLELKTKVYQPTTFQNFTLKQEGPKQKNPDMNQQNQQKRNWKTEWRF